MASIGVDTPGSVLFGQSDAPRRVRGLGNSLMPPNLDHTAFDEVHWVGAAEAFEATRTLHRRHALYMGPTSGAAWLAASWWARRHPEASVVVLLPDEGHRYQDTVYDDAWLRDQDLRLDALPVHPHDAAHPDKATGGWYRFEWARRSLAEVMGGNENLMPPRSAA
jgi:cysteine synthase A